MSASFQEEFDEMLIACGFTTMPRQEYNERRKMFFGGVAVAMKIMRQIGEDVDTEEQCAAAMDELKKQLTDFRNLVEAGKA